MNIKLTSLAGFLVAVISLPCMAEDYKYFPGSHGDSETIKTLELVERVYERGDYERALIIYEKELSPIGDKYAQYMVGFMNLKGQGTRKSRPHALAWYRLAAERNDSAIVTARDSLFKSMKDDEITDSSTVYVNLYRRLGDNQIILDLVREDLELLRQKTGSRLGTSNTSPVMVVNPKTGGMISDAYYDRIRNRMNRRLDYLETNVEIIDIDLSDEMDVKKALEIEIREEMAALDMR